LAPIASRDDLTDDQQSTLRRLDRCFDEADQLHRQYEPRWGTWYGLSRNYRRWSTAYQQANTKADKDVVIDEIKRQWGEPLHIPYGFAVMETNVPRIISQTPRYRARPGELSPQVQEALKPAEARFELDDAEIHYERRLQETVRSGLRYGLGVQKTHWEKRCRSGKVLKKHLLDDGYGAEDSEEIVVYEGPQSESVDIFDFFWDPAARDMQTARFVIHRTWRDLDYVARKVKEGKENRAKGKDQGWADLDLEAIKSLATTQRRSEGWSVRWEAAGASSYQDTGEMFELWEIHDRDQVFTVLGGRGGLLVQEDINPFLHGDTPFDIYRPTIVEQEFCGIGEIEPIAHLLWELDTLRGQRRDAANLALNAGYFYQQGTLDPKKVVVGAGVFVPTLQSPSDVIYPMPFREPPNSGYQEEAAIKADIELASAISESVVGSGGEETATGTQMVQQAAAYRMKLKAKNLHVDLLIPQTAKRKALYEQHVAGRAKPGTQTLSVEDPTAPTGFRHIEMPDTLWAANFELVPIDQSTEPDDPVQRKHDAGELMQTLIPFAQEINPQAAIDYVLDQHDVEDKTSWVKKGPEPSDVASGVAESFVHAMQEAGVDQQEIEQIANAAHAHSEEGAASGPPQPEQQGPEATEQEQAPPAPQPAGA
jgi:hypothetical protein